MERPFQDAVKTCELEDQLHERDVELTESRLQSLASSHHIEQLQERVLDLEVLSDRVPSEKSIVQSVEHVVFLHTVLLDHWKKTYVITNRSIEKEVVRVI